MSLNNGKMVTELTLLQLVFFQKEGYHRLMDLLLRAKSSSESLGILVCEQVFISKLPSSWPWVVSSWLC